MANKHSAAITLTIIGSVTATLLGVAGVMVFVPAQPPTALLAHSTTNTFRVEDTVFDDARTVRVRVDTSDNRTIELPAAGRITATACTPGVPIVSGQIAAEIDGNTILALHTETPPWRELTWGDDGQDVAALRQELRRLGDNLDATGPVTAAVIEAIAARLIPEGAESADLDSIPLDRIMWIPQTDTTMLSCDATLGTTAEAASP